MFLPPSGTLQRRPPADPRFDERVVARKPSAMSRSGSLISSKWLAKSMSAPLPESHPWERRALQVAGGEDAHQDIQGIVQFSFRRQ
eukprot:5080406-Pyramimonas_sp.AAC.1